MSNYATLKADIAGWLLRDDLTAAIPTFIRLAEAQIRRDLRIREMIRTSTLTLSAQSVQVPGDFLEMERIVIGGTPTTSIRYVPPAALYDSDAYQDASGYPSIYTIEGDYFVFAPAPSGSPTALISYYRPFDELDSDADTNWLLVNGYDVYLYGALTHAAPYIKEDSRVAIWANGYASAIRDLNRSSRKAMFAGSPLQVANGAFGP